MGRPELMRRGVEHDFHRLGLHVQSFYGRIERPADNKRRLQRILVMRKTGEGNEDILHGFAPKELKKAKHSLLSLL